MTLADWVSVAVTGGLGLAGLYFANSVKRRARQELDREVTAKRFAAYGAMWTHMEQASAMDAAALAGASGDEQDGRRIDRRKLFDDLTGWYYRDGNGMLLTQDARNVYLAAKANLVCEPDRFLPASARSAVGRDDAVRDRLVVRQLSLLRTAMRSDIAIYTTPWGSELTHEDIAFLFACGVDVSRHPWRESLPQRLSGQHLATLEELEAHPPAWLDDSIGAPPPEDGSRRRDDWRRLALTVHDMHRRLADVQRAHRGRAPWGTGAPEA